MKQSPLLKLCTTAAQAAEIYSWLESKTKRNSTEYEFAHSIQYFQPKFAYLYISICQRLTLIYIDQHMDGH